MALVNALAKETLTKNSTHLPVDGTFCIIQTPEGPLLQIDTYGSTQRKHKGKKSQSIRFSKAAIKQLKAILETL